MAVFRLITPPSLWPTGVVTAGVVLPELMTAIFHIKDNCVGTVDDSELHFCLAGFKPRGCFCIDEFGHFYHDAVAVMCHYLDVPKDIRDHKRVRGRLFFKSQF